MLNKANREENPWDAHSAIEDGFYMDYRRELVSSKYKIKVKLK